MPRDLVQQLDNALPQTQCTQCGFQGCLPYAQAMADGLADLNRCPPGGTATISMLAHLLQKPTLPLNPACGQHQTRQIANIDPAQCIGCTLCIVACPVDAIVGSNRHRHAVLAPLCTGCGLCIAPCPVDCIDMQTVPSYTSWTHADAMAARQRLHARQQRLQRQQTEQERRLQQKAEYTKANHHKAEHTLVQTTPEYASNKSVTLAAAVARARSRRQLPAINGQGQGQA
jgi:electron transport complex protein RnfB